MADANVSPVTVGGQFTRAIVFLPFPIVVAQDGGRIVTASWAGSGTSIPVDSFVISDGSSTGVTGTWNLIQFAEQQKSDPYNYLMDNYAEGSSEPHSGVELSFFVDSPAPSYVFPISAQAFYDNTWNIGLVGPEQSAVRNSNNWVAISNQPETNITDTTAVKSYPANQINFSTPVPVSSFKVLRSYADTTNPLSTPSARYEGAWDIFGHAHTSVPGISLEIMFWTYNHGQDPHIGSVSAIETGIDLSGDGKLWDLYMTPDTAQTGGVTDNYSYAIWYLQNSYQEYSGWVNILAGLRHVLMYYVVPSGPGAPTSPLDLPLTQITRGWEVCSTNYSPLEFRLNDYRVQMQ